MDGGNLRDGCMEVAFEQWIEPGQQDLYSCSIQIVTASGSRLQRYSPVTGSGIGAAGSAEYEEVPVLTECRDDWSLNLGGNTDGYSP